MAFLIKLGLFFVYLGAVIFVLRFLDEVLLRGQPDLMSMPDIRLKAILEQRGVEYSHLYGKREFASQIQATGPISYEELAILERNAGEETPIENFTNYLYFCEQVYDARDNIWFIEIIVQQTMFSDNVWNLFRKKLSKFGVKFGRLYCVNHKSFCRERSWTSSRLVIATPSNNEKKATFCNPLTYTYPYAIEPNAIFKWLTQKVNQKLTVIRDIRELKQNWLDFQFPHWFSPEVRVLYVTKDANVPFFLSSLAVKYAGRVKMEDTNSEVHGMESHEQESNGTRVSATFDGAERWNNLERRASEDDYQRQRSTNLSANTLLPWQSQNGPLVLVINGMLIRVELVSHDYIQFLPVWEHSKDVTCKGYCRIKETDENNSHIRKSTVVNTSGIPCTISGVSSVKNINVMRHAPDGFTFDPSCVICLEDFENLEVVRGLPCKHTFHDACVIDWLLSETSNRLCPSCRFPAYEYNEINAELQLDIDDFCEMFD